MKGEVGLIVKGKVGLIPYYQSHPLLARPQLVNHAVTGLMLKVSELMSCVNVEVNVLRSPSPIVLMSRMRKASSSQKDVQSSVSV